MKGTKYLSDVLDVSQFRTGELNIINAPCGCGKTTCAINKIAELASSPRKVLYLIDTRIGKERLAREPGLIKPCVFLSTARWTASRGKKSSCMSSGKKKSP